MASICDPLLDLGWWLFADRRADHGSDCQRLPGFPSSAATGRSLVGAHGPIDRRAWFELLAGFRFTVIMLRMGKLLHGMGWCRRTSATTTSSPPPRSSRPGASTVPRRSPGQRSRLFGMTNAPAAGRSREVGA
jgi:hypothetical protein